VRRPAAARDCRPARVVFYTDGDWLRLATKLAAAASPCAQYYVSIPPVTADKTKFRWDQGWRIDALGPQFHALAEVNYAAWSRWVAAGNGSWYDAGVQARRNMARDNYDVGRGDGWAVNEASSAVRANKGAARQNLRDLLRGLYGGDGGPPLQGPLFVIGVGQSSSGVAIYKATLESWFEDAPFWTDLSTYVSDFSQEVYGDVRAYAVAGATAQERRDSIIPWLQHPLVLANAGPDSTAVARTFLQQRYMPLANAAWSWGGSFGYTDVAYDVMSQYVSAQVYALRSFGAAAGFPQDRLGFAWAPRAPASLTSSQFSAQSAALEDRLAAAIRDSGETVDPADPGVGACGPAGQNLWCGGDLPGARFADAWQTFATWDYPALALRATTPTVAAGAPSQPLTVQLQVGAASVAATTDTAVTLSSASPAGRFAPTPAGPWTPTLVVTVPAGATSATFAYEDTRAGRPALTAAADGRGSTTLTVQVTPGPLARLSVSPAHARVRVGRALILRARGADRYANAVAVRPRWSLAPRTRGRTTQLRGGAVRFVALRRGTATLVATVGRTRTTAHVTVVR
jgi:hypothetical protein